jgi:DNA modification methylase
MPDDIDLSDLPSPEYEGTVAVDELHTDGDNPNEMTDEQFGLLCDRMAENGWLGGPVVTDTDGLIADGEHRWRAAQEIGLSDVPVKQYAIDDATRRLWRQELNKIHGEHDAKRDALEYDTLLSEGFTEEVETLTDAAGEDLDELLAELRVGDTVGPAYEYDPEHNVYFEDCVEGMRERLDNDSVDMVFTSPPYNVEKTQSGTRESETVDYEDDRTPEEFREFLRSVFSEVCRVLKPEGHLFINLDHDWTDRTCTPSTWIQDVVPVPLRSIVIWSQPTFHRPHYPDRGQFQTNYEPIYHFSADPSALSDKKASSVWEINDASKEDRGDYGPHPAPYPTSLVDHALQRTTDIGDRILDPFMGSGTTAVAAIQNDRDYVGFELDEEGAYKPIIERRIGEAKRAKEATVNTSNSDA